jgi:hypothetical protein
MASKRRKQARQVATIPVINSNPAEGRLFQGTAWAAPVLRELRTNAKSFFGLDAR